MGVPAVEAQADEMSVASVVNAMRSSHRGMRCSVSRRYLPRMGIDLLAALFNGFAHGLDILGREGPCEL